MPIRLAIGSTSARERNMARRADGWQGCGAAHPMCPAAQLHRRIATTVHKKHPQKTPNDHESCANTSKNRTVRNTSSAPSPWSITLFQAAMAGASPSPPTTATGAPTGSQTPPPHQPLKARAKVVDLTCATCESCVLHDACVNQTTAHSGPQGRDTQLAAVLASQQRSQSHHSPVLDASSRRWPRKRGGNGVCSERARCCAGTCNTHQHKWRNDTGVETLQPPHHHLHHTSTSRHHFHCELLLQHSLRG
jgi:hypothetical protein